VPSILITSITQNITTVDDLNFSVRQLVFKNAAGELRSLHDDLPFTELEQVQMWIIWCTKPYISTRLRLSDRIEQAITCFLQKHQGQGTVLDCYDFVCQTFGVSEHKKAVLLRHWTVHPWWYRKKPGDPILLINTKEQQFRHAAIYLGHGLYLSVYGKGGDLEVSTLRDMRREFKTNKVLIVSPRET
jgi:hypothetical protein